MSYYACLIEKKDGKIRLSDIALTIKGWGDLSSRAAFRTISDTLLFVGKYSIPGHLKYKLVAVISLDDGKIEGLCTPDRPVLDPL